MISVTTEFGERSFNLKNFETEKKALNAWHAMRGDPKFDKKVFKFTTSDGEVLKFRIEDIQECKFREAEYIKAEIHHVNDREKQKPKFDYMDMINSAQKKSEEKKIGSFITELAKAGIQIDMQDPMLLKTIDSVRKSEDWKIPMYVNLYKASKGYR